MIIHFFKSYHYAGKTDNETAENKTRDNNKWVLPFSFAINFGVKIP